MCQDAQLTVFVYLASPSALSVKIYSHKMGLNLELEVGNLSSRLLIGEEYPRMFSVTGGK